MKPSVHGAGRPHHEPARRNDHQTTATVTDGRRSARCRMPNVRAWGHGAATAAIDGAVLVGELLSPAGSVWRRQRRVAMRRRGAEVLP